MSLKYICVLPILVIISISLAGCNLANKSGRKADRLTDRERDGLAGPVRAVLTDDVVLLGQNGTVYETQQASSVSIYDENGKRTLQTPFRINLPTGYALTRHEPYLDLRFTDTANTNTGNEKTRSDPQGNITEIDMRDEAGNRSIGRIKIDYQYDDLGNWIKRTASRSIEKDGQMTTQPGEISFRKIVYFNSTPKPETKEKFATMAAAKQLKAPIPENESNLAKGRMFFLQRCTACHGDDGKALTDFAAVMPVKPKNLTGSEVQALTTGEIYSLVNEGIKEAGMPAQKGRISDESIWQIALYVGRLSKKQEGEIAAATQTPAPVTDPASVNIVRRYRLKGKIVAIARETQEVTIEHEDIPGYMGAMTMPFPLKDPKILGRIKKDDRIEATLVVDRFGWRLENVVIK